MTQPPYSKKMRLFFNQIRKEEVYSPLHTEYPNMHLYEFPHLKPMLMSEWNGWGAPISLPGCSGLALAGCKSPPQLLSHSPPQQDGGEKKDGKAHRKHKDREVTYHGQNRLDLEKNNLI